MDSFFLAITWAGSLYFLVPASVVLAALLATTRHTTEALFLLVGLAGASLFSHLLKLLIARPRPPAAGMLVAMPADFSFPSAHTAQITAFACCCALLFARQLPAKGGLLLWTAMVTLVVLVGFSRTYLKVHYLSDVVAGGLLGAAWIFGLSWLLQHLTGRGIG